MPLRRRLPTADRISDFASEIAAIARMAWVGLLLAVLASGSSGIASEPETRIAGRTRAQWNSALASEIPEVRRQAAAALAQFGPAALEELAALVGDSDPATRIWALRGLKRGRPATTTPQSPAETPVKNSTETPALTQVNAPSSHHAWSEEQSRRAVELAVSRLDDANVSVRIAAAATLASHGRLEPALAGLTAALTSPIPGARIEAISELKSLGTAALPAADAIRAADDAPNSGDYVTRIRDQILQVLATSKDTR